MRRAQFRALPRSYSIDLSMGSKLATSTGTPVLRKNICSGLKPV